MKIKLIGRALEPLCGPVAGVCTQQVCLCSVCRGAGIREAVCHCGPFVKRAGVSGGVRWSGGVCACSRRQIAPYNERRL